MRPGGGGRGPSEVWVEVHGPGTSLPQHCRTMMPKRPITAPSGLTWNSNATDVVDGSVAASYQMLRPVDQVRATSTNCMTAIRTASLFRLLREKQLRPRHSRRKFRACPMRAGPANALMRYYKALWSERARG